MTVEHSISGILSLPRQLPPTSSGGACRPCTESRERRASSLFLCDSSCEDQHAPIPSLARSLVVAIRFTFFQEQKLRQLGSI